MTTIELSLPCRSRLAGITTRAARRLLSACAALLLFAALPGSALAQKAFATPQAAADAFVDALATHDDAAVRSLLGADYRRFVPSETDGDDVTAFLAASAKGRAIASDSADRAHLVVGTEGYGWTLPIPLVRSAAGWHFDIKAGADEMRVRRIGRNELAAIQALLAYFDAQKEYASTDRDGDGINAYAQRFLSTPGKRDGLIWSDDPAGSPLGPLYGDETKDGVFHGYRFRILKAQGPAAPGGARSFVVNGRMTRGFAAIAWPARYGDTGVMTFMVSHDGAVYQKDLGRDTDAAARAITRYDPDSSWAPLANAVTAAK